MQYQKMNALFFMGWNKNHCYQNRSSALVASQPGISRRNLKNSRKKQLYLCRISQYCIWWTLNYKMIARFLYVHLTAILLPRLWSLVYQANDNMPYNYVLLKILWHHTCNIIWIHWWILCLCFQINFKIKFIKCLCNRCRHWYTIQMTYNI